MVKPPCSNFRIITSIFWVSEFLGVLRYIIMRNQNWPCDGSDGVLQRSLFAPPT